ncbi:MAG: glycosyltransferase family 39 protein, partial [Deltaproteobacteria bacterium]|nr:glycosyltransferase family 39 protein [Deltaproteobacteria bacterium]
MTFAQKLILTFIILALLMRVPIFLVRYFDPDEFEHLHAARNIYHGMVPYRDYFEHHTPFLHFLLAPLYFIWGDSIPLIFVARGIMLIFTCGILYLTYRLTKMLYGCDAALFATLFLSCTLIFLEKTIEVRPDLPEVIFWLLTIIFLIRGVSNNQRRYFLLAGAMMSCAILCSQKAVFAGLGLALALVWFLCDKRTGWPLKTRAVGCLWIGAGFLIPVGVMCLYFLPNRALDDFIYRNFIMNLGWRSKFWPYGYIRQALKQNPFFCVSGLAGLLIATYQSRHKTEISRGSFAPVVSTYMLIGGLFLMPVPDRQYYLLFIPLLAMYAGRTLATITKYPA